MKIESEIMIYRLSGRLGKKIKEQPERIYPAHPNGYLDWSGHLFYADRIQYIILMNTATHYSIVYPARGIRNFGDYVMAANQHIADFLREDGFELIVERILVPNMATSVFSKALDRSVTGYINDFVNQSIFYLQELSPFETSRRLNETPLTKKKFFNPKEGFQQMSLAP